MKLHIDFETYSEADLGKIGSAAYAEHSSTSVYCVAWSFDDGPVSSIDDPKDNIPSEVAEHIRNGGTVVAHNVQFEMDIINYTLAPYWGVRLLPAQCECTMAMASAHALPLSLKNLGAYLGIEKEKDNEGRLLMLRLCKPSAKTGKHPSEASKDWDGDREKLRAYCVRDVEAEVEIYGMLIKTTDFQTQTFHDTLRINQAGIPIDVKFVDKALAMIEDIMVNVDATVSNLTEGELSLNDLTRNEVMLNWCKSQGVFIKSMAAGEVKKALGSDIPSTVRDVLECRTMANTTSTAKYQLLKDAVNSDGRIHNCLWYHAALTGRWGGRLLQPQNLPRPSYDEPTLEKYRDMVMSDLRGFNDPMEVAKSLIRGTICASDGQMFSCADWSAIEARMLAYLAGQHDLIELFRTGGDPYVAMAAEVYGINPEDVTKSQRQLGKQIILGCGYGMSAKTFEKTCAGYGMNLSELGVTAGKAVETYRASYAKIKSFWYSLGKCAMEAYQTPGAVKTEKQSGIRIKHTSGKLYIMLPSGRCITYQGIQERANERWGGTELSYMFQWQGRYMRTATYGAKLVENVVQGACADLMAHSVSLCHEADMRVVMIVHDEIVIEDSKDRLEELIEIMKSAPKWCSNFPLQAEGWSGKRYRK